MAPRANWKGFLRLSLVTCPVALYPATSDTEKVSFNQINRKTGHRIKYAKVDADTGEEVANEDIIKGKWKQLNGRIKQQWGKLTDDDLTVLEGSREYLAGKVQERYGVTKDIAEQQVKDFEKSLH